MSDLDFMRDPGPYRWVVFEEYADGNRKCYGPFRTEAGAAEYAWDLRHEGCERVYITELLDP